MEGRNPRTNPITQAANVTGLDMVGKWNDRTMETHMERRADVQKRQLLNLKRFERHK